MGRGVGAARVIAPPLVNAAVVDEGQTQWAPEVNRFWGWVIGGSPAVGPPDVFGGSAIVNPNTSDKDVILERMVSSVDAPNPCRVNLHILNLVAGSVLQGSQGTGAFFRAVYAPGSTPSAGAVGPGAARARLHRWGPTLVQLGTMQPAGVAALSLWVQPGWPLEMVVPDAPIVLVPGTALGMISEELTTGEIMNTWWWREVPSAA